MKREKNAVRYDADGARKVMRKRDYLADFSGQLGLGLMANMAGQLTYFYTDKVGLAVGGVGIILMIAKIIDAFTDVIVGNMVDHSKGGNKKILFMDVPYGNSGGNRNHYDVYRSGESRADCWLNLCLDHKSALDSCNLYDDRNTV